MLGDVILIRFQNISCYCLTTTCRFFVTCFLISKHLMLLFNSLLLQSHSLSSFISKHLMLLFNSLLLQSHSLSSFISKHLMLLFNKKQQFKERFQVQISKHLMLLFNTLSFFFIFLLVLFQNISCYCLTDVKNSSIVTS